MNSTQTTKNNNGITETKPLNQLSFKDKKRNFTHIIDLSSELLPTSHIHYKVKYEKKYKYIPLLDLEPLTIDDIIKFCSYVEEIIKNDKEISIYVHCSLGVSRSYAMVASYLVWCGKYNPNDVNSYLHSLNSNIIIRKEYLSLDILISLRKYSLYQKNYKGKNVEL